MGLIERIKSALGLGTSASSPSSASSTPDGQSGDDGDDTGPTSVTDVGGDEQVEGAQTGVAVGDDSDDVDVTVEYEPDTRSEDAVKGTDTADTATAADVEPADERADATDAETADTPAAEGGDGSRETAAAEADDASSGTAAPAGAGVDLEEITGIGPAYAERLRDAGVEDVAALAAADAAALADRTGLGEGRVGKWIERAETR